MANELLAQIGPRTVQTNSASSPVTATRQNGQVVPTAQPASVAKSRRPEDAASGKELLTGGKSEQTAGNSEARVGEDSLSKTVDELNDYVQNLHREIQFSVDNESNQTIIKVIDANTGEVIRQLPPDEMMRLVKRLDELEGLLVREKA